MNPNFQIIGGGLIGLSSAYALLLRGAQVRVIEANANVAQETSFANAGMVHASLADPWNGPNIGGQILGSLFGRPSPIVLRAKELPNILGWGTTFLAHSTSEKHWQATKENYLLAVRSMDILAKWRKDLNIQDDVTSTGLLKTFRDAKAYDKAKTLTKRLQSLGLAAAFLNPQQTVAQEPALTAVINNIYGGIFYPDDYKADAYLFCQALERAIIALGGELITGARVTKLVRSGDKTIGVTVRTSKEGMEYLAGTTVIACGAHSTTLLKQSGIKTKLMLKPIKGYSLTFKNRVPQNAQNTQTAFPKMPVVDESLHCAVTPFSHGLRIAGTAEITGFNHSEHPARLKPLLEMLRGLYPDIAYGLRLADAQVWHGFRPVSAYGKPIIKSLAPGLAINTAHAHMGWTQSAGSAEVLADIVTGAG